MSQKLMTPGVYIENTNAFPNSIVEIATSIPAFIGYTEKASVKNQSLIYKPTRINSFAEYHQLFGGAFNPQFTIDPVEPGKTAKHEIIINGETKAINYVTDHDSYMYRGIQFFFNNGGGTCYIVSVGTYGEIDKVEVKRAELEAGLETLLSEQEPTIVVIPDAVKLKDDCYNLYKKVLAQCAELQNRFAILDIHNGDQYRNRENANDDNITNFREKIGTECLSYGAAYFPWLNTNIVQKEEITFENLNASVNLEKLLPESAAKNFMAESLFNLESNEDLKETQELESDYIRTKKRNYHQGLLATSPTYSKLLDEIRAVINLLPPSPAMAGIYTTIDNSIGVWKSPANISLASVNNPSVDITHDEQEDLNIDSKSGKSINAIRTFPGIGTLVWGGRTLDGNSLDWRYINVRRTIIMLEQSIKLALQAFVLEPNDANTWATVKSMMVNYLTEKWKQGALAGAYSEDAFEVQIGLGITMTSLDILEGKMIVFVKFAIARPAEFIVVTFEQQMQKS